MQSQQATPKQDVWLRQRYSAQSRASDASSVGKCPISGQSSPTLTPSDAHDPNSKPNVCPVSGASPDTTSKKTDNDLVLGSDAGGCPMGSPDPNAPKGEYYHTYLHLDSILGAQQPVSGREGLTWNESFPDLHRVCSGSAMSDEESNLNDSIVSETENAKTGKNKPETGSLLPSPKTATPMLPKSRKEPAHDELFFIITHQTYELWFKQILHELDSVYKIFSKEIVADSDLELACHRLHRVTKIQEVLISQVSVLETMTPMDFLDFRDYLAPASGFQSWQFRVIEMTLGLPIEGRKYGSESFLMGVLHGEQRQRIQNLRDSKIPSLNKLVENWLERIPLGSYDFWLEYQQAVENMIQKDTEIIRAVVPQDRQEAELKGLKQVRSNFESLLMSDIHQEMMDRGQRRWSQKATLSALFIYLYRTEPMLASPFRLLNLLTEIDEHWCTWRLRHAAMAHRMIGMKIGTGGTSGVEYLNKAATENKAFRDLWQLSTYLLPTTALPPLPRDLKERLSFHHDVKQRTSAAISEGASPKSEMSSPHKGPRYSPSPRK